MLQHFTRRFKSTGISRLPNGIRITSLPSPGHFMTLGVFVDAGTKYELPSTAGFTHVLDRMAFKSTADYKSDQLVAEIELLGGNVMSQSGREHVMYQAAIFNNDLEKMLKLFASIVRSPLLLQDEITHVCESSMFELDAQDHDMDALIPELLHSTAYKDTNGGTNTHGNSLLGTRERLAVIKADDLREFRETWFTPERIVIAGVGMPHEVLTLLVEKYFGGMPATSPEIFKAQLRKTREIEYTGGITIIDSKALPANPNPDYYPFTNVHVAFESMSMPDPDIYALATLASMLGGGGSFSAGGPGKGMYTRLYTDVLNRYQWIESANKIHHSYFQTGLFGISAAVPPIKDAHDSILPIICDQLLQATQNISQEDLSRAKNQLKSNLLMSLESKLVLLEDIGRQALLKNSIMSPAEVVKRIDTLSAEDLKRAARRVVLCTNEKSTLDFEGGVHWNRTGRGEPCVVVRGELFSKDPLLKVDNVLRKWGVGR